VRLRVEGFDAGDGGGPFSRRASAQVNMGTVLCETGDGVITSIAW
jgi:hypothetical protein